MEKGVIFYNGYTIPFEEDGVNVTMTIIGFSQLIGEKFKELKIVYEKDVDYVGSEDDINQDDYKVVKK